MHLLVIIPCLNEAATLGEIIDNIPLHIPGVTQTEILVVDDGSTDDGSTDDGSTDDGTDLRSAIDGIGPTYAERLSEAGIETVEQLSSAAVSTVAEAAGVSEKRAEGWIEQSR